MAKKLAEVVLKRHFLNLWICMKCNAKMRTDLKRINEGRIKCRKCQSKDLRLKAKESRGSKV